MMGFTKIGLAAAALMMTASSAFAGQITFNYYTATSTSVNTTGPATTVGIPINASFTVAKFDPVANGNAFGNATLTAINITFASTVNTLAEITGVAGDAYSGAFASLPFSLSDSATGAPVTLFSNTVTADGGDGTGNGPGYSGTLATTGVNILAAATTESFSNTTSISSAAFAPYLGSTGTVGFNIFSGRVSAGGNGVPGQDFFGGDGSASAQVTVQYVFTVPSSPGVPEPASLALLGAGMVGLGVLRRRIK